MDIRALSVKLGLVIIVAIKTKNSIKINVEGNSLYFNTTGPGLYRMFHKRKLVLSHSLTVKNIFLLSCSILSGSGRIFGFVTNNQVSLGGEDRKWTISVKT